MDQFDFDTKALTRAENIIRTVLENKARTDIETLLPLIGYSDAEKALEDADRFGEAANRASTATRAQAVKDAKAVVAGIPPKTLAAFDRKVKR